jgi:imidazolonepropionase-like amidohydrolase
LIGKIAKGLATLLGVLLFAGGVAAEPARTGLAITHVTVVRTGDGSLTRDATVLIRGDRIESVSSGSSIPEGVTVVDAEGRFLIPGLWDMHVHWYAEDYLPLFVANGVTGVRQMFGNPAHLHWRTRFERGELEGPRQVIASRIVDGPKPVWPASITAANDNEGRLAVRTALREGADFIKVYSLLPRDAYFAIAEEAKSRGVPFAGHVPLSVTAVEASDAGQRSFEHLSGVLLAASSEEGRIREAWSVDGWREQTDRLVATYDPEKARALYARIAENGTWQCPTLTVLRNIALIPDEAIVDDPNLKYMPPTVRSMWDPKRVFRWTSKKGYEKALEIVGEMHEAGVRFLAGTDVLNPYCFPGFSLHGELELLVEAGLSPLEALQAATLNPAEFLGKRDIFGTVAAGKTADLVLLDANPLEDISNTRKIHAVVTAGRLLSRHDLDKMLSEIEVRAGAATKP